MSCLFDSLSFFVKDMNSKDMRQLICSYLESDPMLIGRDRFSKLISGKKIEDYITSMRNTNVWGGAFEIRAFCDIFKCKVIVHNIRDVQNSTIEFSPKIFHGKIISIIWNGSHFTPGKGDIRLDSKSNLIRKK